MIDRAMLHRVRLTYPAALVYEPLTRGARGGVPCSQRASSDGWPYQSREAQSEGAVRERIWIEVCAIRGRMRRRRVGAWRMAERGRAGGAKRQC